MKTIKARSSNSVCQLLKNGVNSKRTKVKQTDIIKLRRPSFSLVAERDQFIDGNTNFFGKKIPVLVFSREQVLKVFSFIETNTKGWPPVPTEWYKDPVAFKLGGKLTNFKIRVTVDLQEVPVQKPVLMSLIKGSTDENHFVLVGYQIKLQRQSKIISELIQSFANQIKQGWRPKFVSLNGISSRYCSIELLFSRLDDRFYFVAGLPKNMIISQVFQ